MLKKFNPVPSVPNCSLSCSILIAPALLWMAVPSGAGRFLPFVGQGGKKTGWSSFFRPCCCQWEIFLGPLNSDGHMIFMGFFFLQKKTACLTNPSTVRLKGLVWFPVSRDVFRNILGGIFQKHVGWLWWYGGESMKLVHWDQLPSSLFSTGSCLVVLWDSPTVTSVTAAQISPDHLLLHGSGPCFLSGYSGISWLISTWSAASKPESSGQKERKMAPVIQL